MAERTRWYTVCYPRDISYSVAVAVLSGTIATNRSDAWKRFLSQNDDPLETKKHLQKKGYRVRCFYMTFEVVE